MDSNVRYKKFNNFQLILMLLAVFGVIVYRVSISFVIIRNQNEEIIHQNYRLIASATGAMISATFIVIFKMVFPLKLIKYTLYHINNESFNV